jgi:hypothetical protein
MWCEGKKFNISVVPDRNLKVWRLPKEIESGVPFPAK